VKSEMPLQHQAPDRVDGSAAAPVAGDAGAARDSMGRGFAGFIMRDPGAADVRHNPEKTAGVGRDFESLLITRPSLPPEYQNIGGGSPGSTLDAYVGKVFDSVMERIRATDFERGRARFEIETQQGESIRVRLRVDGNVVSVRIDAPTEQVRDLLAGHARQLSLRLETEGLIPDDIEFCLAGGRDETAGQEPHSGVGHRFRDAVLDTEMDNLTMVETEARAFESWA
jgi:hypothetical protein